MKYILDHKYQKNPLRDVQQEQHSDILISLRVNHK